MQFIVCNGSFVSANQPAITAQNLSLKFGEGLFETIRVCNNHIPLAAFHKDRLFASLQILQLKPISEATWQQWLALALELCLKNKCGTDARVRLTVFQQDEALGYCIEAQPLDVTYLQWQERGVEIGLCPFLRKQTDILAPLKSTSYLIYRTAAHYAKAQGWDEALVLNSHNCICDSNRSNLFAINKGQIFTPPYNDGGIAGVMRACLLQQLASNGYAVQEKSLSTDDLLQSDEVFLTNALWGIRWVASFGEKKYDHQLTKTLYHAIMPTIFY